MVSSIDTRYRGLRKKVQPILVSAGNCLVNGSPDLLVRLHARESYKFVHIPREDSPNVLLGAAFHLTLFRMPVASSNAARIVDHGLKPWFAMRGVIPSRIPGEF